MAIVDDIRAFLAESFYPPPDLRDDDPLIQGGIIDSRGMLELVAFLETKYSLHVADGEIHPETLRSLGTIAAFVERKLRPPPTTELPRFVDAL